MRNFIGSIAVIGIIVFVFVQFFSDQTGVTISEVLTEPTQTHTATPLPNDTDTADEEPVPSPIIPGTIETIPVTPNQRIEKYDRDLFGGWNDLDGNGCRTRDDILTRDMADVVTENGCKVLSGILTDPYSGKVVPFTFGEKSSQAVQIDHVVSLSAAWKAGAHAWDEQLRAQFANDPRNLLAVDGPTNNSKSDRGPASWMPSTAGNPSYDCSFAGAYVDVLVAYGLSAPAEDIAALREALATC